MQLKNPYQTSRYSEKIEGWDDIKVMKKGSIRLRPINFVQVFMMTAEIKTAFGETA